MAYHTSTATIFSQDTLGCSDAEWSTIRACALPEGFRFLVDENEAIVEPVLYYLYDRCFVSAKIESVGNTQSSYNADLFEWFSYLSVAGICWNDVRYTDISQYRESLSSAISPRTGLKYKPATIRRRLLTIIGFYRWAFQKGLTKFNVEILTDSPSFQPRDTDLLTHTRSARQTTTSNELLPPIKSSPGVEALTVRELSSVLKQTGPLPSEYDGSATSSIRAASSLAAATGMRISEVIGLTVQDIKLLRQDERSGHYPLLLTKTKGLQPRKVLVDQTLYDELKTYIAEERDTIVSTSNPTNALFVNREDSQRNPGGTMTAHTLWRWFHAAVRECGLVEDILVWREGHQKLETRNTHSFHNLRHTFAVVMYHQLRREGNPSPWLRLKVLLGHKHLSTTVNTYLSSVGDDDAYITDTMFDYLRALR